MAKQLRPKIAEPPQWRLSQSNSSFGLNPGGVTTIRQENWRGSFERFTFGPAFHIHFATVEVDHPAEIAVQGSGGTAPVSLFCVASGQGAIRFPDIAHASLKPGVALLFACPSRRATFELPGSQTLRFLSVAFAPEVLRLLFDGAIPAELAPLAANSSSHLITTSLTPSCRRLIARAFRDGPARPLKRIGIEAAALHCVAEITQQLAPKQRTRDIRVRAGDLHLARKARELVAAALPVPPSLDQLAAELGIPPERLLHAFQQVFGETPARYAKRERLELARRLLADGGLTMKDVAWRAGYSHVSNFINAFSAHFGRSPRRMTGNGKQKG